MAPPVSKVVRKIVKNEEEVAKELCTLIEKLSNEAISARGQFSIGLSGGSMAKFVCGGLPGITTTWAKWKLFFCDERLVSFTDPESTYKIYRAGLVGPTPLTEDQFVIVNPDLEVKAAAEDYEKKVQAIFPNKEWPCFDLLLLGMGPDGHTASLFPGHVALDENKAWVVGVSDSPKPPPCRVTLTLPAINHSACCVFAMAGQGKADMVKRVLGDGEDLPCSRVKPSPGQLVWILDEAAAAKL
ncbi:hypothetical protein Pmani_021212 [Petrolisthes manimaculis]|uniref:6-phosphogluconolactonase n=1 Tax=Petrolisthes manimaculis TaxID=1843537 RepID=A0AAE1PEN9_9EUCA|nr:hypothetical protein Pmani_021212 [Petrolisthes manimaculis]